MVEGGVVAIRGEDGREGGVSYLATGVEEEVLIQLEGFLFWRVGHLVLLVLILPRVANS